MLTFRADQGLIELVTARSPRALRVERPVSGCIGGRSAPATNAPAVVTLAESPAVEAVAVAESAPAPDLIR